MWIWYFQTGKYSAERSNGYSGALGKFTLCESLQTLGDSLPEKILVAGARFLSENLDISFPQCPNGHASKGVDLPHDIQIHNEPPKLDIQLS